MTIYKCHPKGLININKIKKKDYLFFFGFGIRYFLYSLI